MIVNLNISKYINNISGLQVFQILRFGTLFLINIVFAKYIPINENGNYQTLIFVAGLVTSFWISGLIQSFLTLYKNNKTFGFYDISKKSPKIFNLFILVSFLSLLAFFVVYIFEKNIAEVEFQTENIPYLNLLLIYIFLSGPTYIIEYIYLVKDKPKSVIKYGFISFLVQFILVVSPAIFHYGISYCLWGLIGSTIIRYIWLLFLLLRYSTFVISLNFMKEHFLLALPLILSALLSGSIPYINGIIISSKINKEAFTIFRYGAMELPFVYLFATAFSNAMVQEFSTGNLSELLIKIKNKSLRLMHFLFPVTIIFLLLSNWLYPLIFSHDFTKSAGIFNVFLVLIVSRLIFPQTILIGLKQTRVIMFASLCEIILNTSLSLIFINYYGIIGVAYATFIASVFEKLISVIYCSIYLKINPQQYISLSKYFAYSFITIIVYFIVNYI